jgi:hypothetical protein
MYKRQFAHNLTCHWLNSTVHIAMYHTLMPVNWQVNTSATIRVAHKANTFALSYKDGYNPPTHAPEHYSAVHTVHILCAHKMHIAQDAHCTR